MTSGRILTPDGGRDHLGTLAFIRLWHWGLSWSQMTYLNVWFHVAHDSPTNKEVPDVAVHEVQP